MHRFADAGHRLANSFDKEFGGFGVRPKFPHPTTLNFTCEWRSSAHDEDPICNRCTWHADINAHGRSGLYDQLGGGFSRYTP